MDLNFILIRDIEAEIYESLLLNLSSQRSATARFVKTLIYLLKCKFMKEPKK